MSHRCESCQQATRHTALCDACEAAATVDRWLRCRRPLLMVQSATLYPRAVYDQRGANVGDLTAAVLNNLVSRLYDARRALDNIAQDQAENALVPVSLYDAVKQALADVSPDHPALRTHAPSFGVWESLSRELRELRAQNNMFRMENRRWRKAYATARAVPCAICDGTGLVGSFVNNTLAPCMSCASNSRTVPPNTETNQ